MKRKFVIISKVRRPSKWPEITRKIFSKTHAHSDAGDFFLA